MPKDRGLRYLLALSIAVALISPLTSIYLIYPRFTQLLVDTTEDEAVRLGTHLAATLLPEDGPLSRQTITDGLRHDTREAVQNFGLMKLKIFSPAGETVHSTDDADIGKMNEQPFFREVVAAGTPYTKIATKNTRSLEGQVVTADVVETYVPTMDATGFRGAFEIYYDITARHRALTRVLSVASALPILTMSVFLVVVVATLFRLDRSISERRKTLVSLDRLNRQLLASTQELKERNEEIQSFAYIVSHDLRAPLVNLKGFTNELSHSLQEATPLLRTCAASLGERERRQLTTLVEEEIPESLGFIGSSVTKMDGLINAILQLSRLGRRRLAPEPVDMEGLIQATLKTLGHQIEQKQVAVTVGDLPAAVADRTSMDQVVSNLLDNALKYLQPGRPGEIHVFADANGVENTYHVRDNGRGMAAEDIPRAFELFRRVGKNDVPGEGMGLAYSRALVRRHGGRLWCDSEPGAGTVFHFSIPHAAPPAGEAAPGEPADG